MLNIPLALLTDSYKASHYVLYPKADQMVAYGEFRQPYDKDPVDHRIVFYGIRYIIETYIAHQWTEEQVAKADLFFKTHNVGYSPFPFPRDLFLKFIKENNGYFPIIIEALPEGTVCYPHVPVYQITVNKEYAPLCTYLETLLTMVWYPTTVATLSRRCRSLIEAAFTISVEEDQFNLVDSRLHDFGFRGCTTVEQSIIGGSAHLLNFMGSDTMSASYYAQFHLNEGKPIAQSIPATEHSVMTCWPTEKEAFMNFLEHYGSGVLACVMDSYDYAQALSRLLPVIASKKLEKGGFLVLRPDSGDPIETVLMALRAAENIFGSDVNRKGFKVIRGCSVIQGDGVNIHTIEKILDAALHEKFSAQNIAFGMGGGLLQKVNRDTMSFATKLSSIHFSDQDHRFVTTKVATILNLNRDIMKTPKTDSGKISLPGVLAVVRDENEIPTVYPKEDVKTEQLMQVVYDHGPVALWPTFDTLRTRVQSEWNMLPKKANVISENLQSKIERVKQQQEKRTSDMLASV